MSLTITPSPTKIKIKGTSIELESVYAWLEISSSIAGQMNSALQFYESQEAFTNKAAQLNVDIDGSQIVTNLGGAAPALSIAESDWSARLEAKGYSVVINQ